jgi:hypothetical protein
MLIKSANNKAKRLALLENLQKSTLLDPRQKDWLRTELRKGESRVICVKRLPVPVSCSGG